MQNPKDESLHQNNAFTNLEFYRDFINIEEAKDFAKLLDDNRIKYSLEGAESVIDSAIVGSGLIPKAIIKIAPADFKVVNAILKEDIDALPPEIINSHYLNQLDNHELKEIFYQQEGWTIEDIYTAKKILSNRGIKVKKEEIETLRHQSLDETRKGKTASWLWITLYSLGILFGIFVSVFLAIAGLGMAYYYAFGKSTDADGNGYYVYDESTRQIGTILFFGGITAVIIEILFFTYILPYHYNYFSIL